MRVSLTGRLRDCAAGAAFIDMEAATIRELLGKLRERYPAMAGQLDEGIAVSVDGVIYRDDWTQPLPPDAEVFLIPRIAGG